MPIEYYLLDTGALSPLLVASDPLRPAIERALVDVPNDRIYVSAIARGESEYGFEVDALQPAPKVSAAERQAYLLAMAAYPVLPVDHHTAGEYGSLRATLFHAFAPKRSSGQPKKGAVPEEITDPTTGLSLGIQENDLWIVSSAKQHNFVLVTADNQAGMQRVLDAASYRSRTVLLRR